MNSIKTENCIAIDFGTSNTAVYVYKQGKYLNPVYTAETYYCIPSVAVIDKSGVHVPALLDKAQVSKAYIYNAKRILGKVKSQFEDSEIDTGMFHSPLKFDEYQNPYFEVSYKVGRNKETRNIYTFDVVTEILKKCKVEAEKALDNHLEVRDCVMTIPNYFFDTSKKALKEAAKRAGLNVLYFLKEPIAAGICCLDDKEKKRGENRVIYMDIKEGEMVMVFDFKEDSLDLTLMVRNDDDFEVKAQGGDPGLGGDKIDELFCSHVLQKYKDEYGEDLLGGVGSKKYKRNYPKLLTVCREAKEHLSAVLNCDVPLSEFTAECDDVTVSQEDFEGIIMSKIKPRLDKALENDIFKRNIDQIKHVILVGGSSKIPYIHRYIRQWIPNAKVHTNQNPHTVVVEGAMRHLVNEYKVEEVFEDSLGFEVSKEMSEHFFPGIRLPCSTIKYFTLHENKEDNQINVYRKVNGKWQLQGKIDLQATREMGVSTDQTVQIRVTCSSDTTVTYTVLDRRRKEIGNLSLALSFFVCSDQFTVIYPN